MDQSLSSRDQKVIWHPYTQHKNMLPPIAIVKGDGALLFDDRGNSYIDAISSWWVNTHGHAHPYIAEKIFEQASKLEHVIFTGFTHEPAVQLAERLLSILPGPFSRVFYSDNGSTAVEVAIKMAIQFWRNNGSNIQNRRRHKILAFKNAYHGDTFGAMSVSGRSIFTAPFGDYLFDTIFIDKPEQGNIGSLKNSILEHAGEIACFIYEPLLQAAGGMLMHDAEKLDELLSFIKEQGILCIADEVLTGFGRLGKLFAGSWLQQTPDIICLSKGLTGGTLALGATACTQQIFDAFKNDDRSRTFFHGHSFTANPIACAAALASLDLLEKKECLENINYITHQHRNFVAACNKEQQDSNIKNVRCLGTILAFEMQSDQNNYLNSIGNAVTARALENGIYIRPLGNTVYIMPPYCINRDQLEKLYDFLKGLMKDEGEQLSGRFG